MTIDISRTKTRRERITNRFVLVCKIFTALILITTWAIVSKRGNNTSSIEDGGKVISTSANPIAVSHSIFDFSNSTNFVTERGSLIYTTKGLFHIDGTPNFTTNQQLTLHVKENKKRQLCTLQMDCYNVL